MKCLIIAAGRGLRLSVKGDSKPLVPLLGLPLIERVILTAEKSGLTDFYIVTGYHGSKIRAYLNELNLNNRINIKYITNNEWEKENGISVLKAKNIIRENFILLMSDHIFNENILIKLQEEKIENNEVILAVDYKTETRGLIDNDDFTKVDIDDKKNILNIGKDIEKYNAYDTGIFLCSTAVFGAIEESLDNGNGSLSGGIRILAGRRKAKVLDIKDNDWIDIDDEKTFKKAESKLLDTLEKSSDGPVSRYLNRPISTRITKYLVRTNITPNFLSFLSFFLCCTAAFFFFLGNLLLGGILAQVSSIIDGCDGEVARLKFRVSEFGGWFDAVLDRYADAFLLFGLTYYAYLTNGSFLTIVIGFLAIIGTFMNSYTADKYDGLMKRKLDSKGHYFRIGRDVRIFIIFLGALMNQPLLTLLLIALFMNIENIRRVVVLYKNG